MFGFNPSKRITLSNNFINGDSDFSTGCDGYHYWTFEMVGEDDQITMKNNYIYKTAGRGPALSGSTLLHAVNNVWEDVNGHAIEGGDTAARGIFKGNVFIKVKQLVSDYQGRFFSSPDTTANAQCERALGRACEANVLDQTTDEFEYTDTSFFGDFEGLSIAGAEAASEIKSSVPSNTGAGKISSSSSSSSSSSNGSNKAVSEEVTEPTVHNETTSAGSAATPEPEPAEASSGAGTVGLYGQCGVQGYSGATSCSSGKCEFINDWYSQCV